MTGQMRYFCADGRHLPDGHNIEECPPCLRAQRDGLRREYESHINVNLVARLREMDRRVQLQRTELARLSRKVSGPAAASASAAFDAWCMPLERTDRRFASVAFRAGWQAARRALCVPDDRATQAPSATPEKK